MNKRSQAFSLGERVRTKVAQGGFFPRGAAGTVNLIEPDGDVWVDFDAAPGVHEVGGERIWCVDPRDLTLEARAGAQP